MKSFFKSKWIFSKTQTLATNLEISITIKKCNFIFLSLKLWIFICYFQRQNVMTHLRGELWYLIVRLWLVSQSPRGVIKFPKEMSIYYLTGEGVREVSAFSESTEMYMYMFSYESYGCVVYESNIFIWKNKVLWLKTVSFCVW